MRLFRERGYDGATVEDIAEAAEVSPSTFFRYFPTKEDVVLRDDYDELLLEIFVKLPPDLTPLQACREAVRSIGGITGAFPRGGGAGAGADAPHLHGPGGASPVDQRARPILPGPRRGGRRSSGAARR